MPPKFKFKPEEIVDAAFSLVREKGWHMLTTRAVAEALGTSARPIYSFFKSMDELETELVRRSVSLLYDYMNVACTGDPWIDHGIGYVMFAKKEPHLFRGSNNEKNIGRYKEFGEKIWQQCTDSLADYGPFQGLTADQIYKVQALRWLMAHGLAFQVSNPPPGLWDDDGITEVIQAGSVALLAGLKQQFDS